MQVSISDLLNALTFFPTCAANAFAGYYIFTGFFSVIGFGHFSLSLVRIYLMFVLVLDRFCTVFMPFWYQRQRIKIVLPLSVGAWILAFGLALVTLGPAFSLKGSYIHQNKCYTFNAAAVCLSNVCNVILLIQ
jgi:hypothetical protein